MAVLKNILSRVKKEQRRDYLDECWICNGESNQYGYAVYAWRDSGKRRRTGMHRYVYGVLVGTIPEGMCVCHHCDQPACCNPSHLFLGTRAENIADAGRKGRMGTKKRKLTERQVLEIMDRYDAGVNRRQLGRDFGVHTPQIYRIGRREQWKHI